MRWEARTSFVDLGVGVAICIYRVPQVPGEAQPQMLGDHEMPVQLGDDRWIEARVTNATPVSAILTAPDGVRFQITPHRDGDRSSGVTWPGGAWQDWIVRSQIVPGSWSQT